MNFFENSPCYLEIGQRSQFLGSFAHKIVLSGFFSSLTSDYYTLILSYISVISLFVSFVFELGYIFPQSHDMCRISFNSYLNFCIQKSGMSATKFPQSFIFSARIPRRYHDFSHVWPCVKRAYSFIFQLNQLFQCDGVVQHLLLVT